MRNLKLLPILFFLLFSLPATADPARWIIRDKDTTIILFGTIHVLSPGTPWMSPLMREDIGHMDALFLEVNPADINPQAMAPLIKSLGLYAEPPGLFERLEDSARLEVRTAMMQTGLDMDRVNVMRPWFAATTLAAAAFNKAGFKKEEGVEAQLIKRLKAVGKGRVIGLETMADQLNLFATLPEDAQFQMLRQTARQATDAKGFIDALTKAWSIGDIESVAKIMHADFAKTPGLYDRVIVARNRKWAERIEAFMQEPGNFLVAVGAGHLAGEDNLIDFLEMLAINTQRMKR